jgi:hypothetical protein
MAFAKSVRSIQWLIAGMILISRNKAQVGKTGE